MHHQLTTSLTPQTSQPAAVLRHGNGRLCQHPDTCPRRHFAPRRRGDDVSLSTVQTGGVHSTSPAGRRRAGAR